ncbi:hypothetical protein C8R47DRAFT_1078514 [Mycena vitilis]|nr:hypothetical protein C8R47DRAFT_1078514 [Mycena vitilis]
MLQRFTKRTRIYVACVNCRNRKVRCVTVPGSEEIPCKRCTEKGLSCLYLAVCKSGSTHLIRDRRHLRDGMRACPARGSTAPDGPSAYFVQNPTQGSPNIGQPPSQARTSPFSPWPVLLYSEPHHSVLGRCFFIEPPMQLRIFTQRNHRLSPNFSPTQPKTVARTGILARGCHTIRPWRVLILSTTFLLSGQCTTRDTDTTSAPRMGRLCQSEEYTGTKVAVFFSVQVQLATVILYEVEFPHATCELQVSLSQKYLGPGVIKRKRHEFCFPLDGSVSHTAVLLSASAASVTRLSPSWAGRIPGHPTDHRSIHHLKLALRYTFSPGCRRSFSAAPLHKHEAFFNRSASSTLQSAAPHLSLSPNRICILALPWLRPANVRIARWLHPPARPALRRALVLDRNHDGQFPRDVPTEGIFVRRKAMPRLILVN